MQLHMAYPFQSNRSVRAAMKLFEKAYILNYGFVLGCHSQQVTVNGECLMYITLYFLFY